MTWTKPADLRAQIQKLWDRGDLLTAMATGEQLFPQRLLLKGPTSAEMADRFGEVRAWIADLRDLPYCRIEMRQLNHRVVGPNAVPVQAWIDSADHALAMLGKQQDAKRFAHMIELTRQRQPRLLAWLAKRPLRALELQQDWPRLLDIVHWVHAHPRPGVYLRQVDIPGVHSKFIEANRSVLAELLDSVLPTEAIDSSASGIGEFARRYGFRDKPLRIRFRMLDPAQGLLDAGDQQDITLDATSFARLDPKIERVFITENEVNFLAFPKVAGSIVIFGAGYGFDVLADARWLLNRPIHYWGDIDTHGFAILDQLRNRFRHVESFLMDRNTLMACEAHWGKEECPTTRDLARLNPQEQALYDDLRDNRLGERVRLEQERVGFTWIEAALLAML